MNASNFFARRVLSGDIAEIGELCAKNRDYSFFTPKMARALLKKGEGWCCIDKGKITAFCGFLSVDADCELCEECRKTMLFSPNTLILLPIYADDFFAGHGRFLEWCCSRAGAYEQPVCPLLPVKSGGEHLSLYFSLGFFLSAVRPLYELRPNYIFFRGLMQLPRISAIMVNESDTLSVSKFLENGFFGVDTIIIDNSRRIELAQTAL